MNKPILDAATQKVALALHRPSKGMHHVSELIALLIRKYELDAELRQEKRGPSQLGARTNRHRTENIAADNTSQPERAAVTPTGMLTTPVAAAQSTFAWYASTKS